MDCKLDRNLLHAYLDGELSLQHALEVEEHLAICQRCSFEESQGRGIREAIRRLDLFYRMSVSLEQRILSLAAGGSQGKRPSRYLHWIWALAGAGATATLLLIVFTLSRSVAVSPVQDVVANHIRSLMLNHLTDVLSSDRHTVKPWFNGKVEFAPPVQDLTSQGYELTGARIDFLENRKVAALVYHRALHAINLYVWPAQDTSSSAVETQTLQGYHVLSWKKNGFEFRAVSDLNIGELRQFARLLMN